jgi:hypothetical protein
VRAADNVTRDIWLPEEEKSKTYFFTTNCFLTTTCVAQFCTQIIVFCCEHNLRGMNLRIQTGHDWTPTKKKVKAYHKPEGMFKFMTVTSVCGKIVLAFTNMNISQWVGNLWYIVVPPSHLLQSANWKGDFSEIPWFSGKYSNLNFEVHF